MKKETYKETSKDQMNRKKPVWLKPIDIFIENLAPTERQKSFFWHSEVRMTKPYQVGRKKSFFWQFIITKALLGDSNG